MPVNIQKNGKDRPMRLADTVTEERERFVKALLILKPDLSGPKVAGEVKKKFGAAMRLHTIYDIRDAVRKELKLPPITTTPKKEPKGVTQAGRQPATDNSGNPFPLMIRVAPGAGDVIEAALAQLRGLNVSNLKVTASQDNWAVIDIAT
jgi:hypothetical protein